ncbi:MAG: hypothetical protein CYPHOPRED_001520 [Cyphobasidiales sp. Tagirdzhanova-0007]|nr:MAG: hypothetical protein CYPHOPRED_001520 [Cyphobasidiales sp. Tagirdzhanova-0007]
MAESFNLADLVHGVSQGSMSTKMATPRLPLENPVKESERRKREKDIAKMAKQRMKAERKRRRSGRKVTPELLTNVNKKKALSGKALIRGHVSYELFEPLHKLWLGYISELLNLPLRNTASASEVSRGEDNHTVAEETIADKRSPSLKELPQLGIRAEIAQNSGISLNAMQAWQAKLVKADFHGAKIMVTKARHPSLVGVGGIVVQETEGTFRIVTDKNDIKVIPKPNVVFVFKLPLQGDDVRIEKDLQFELYGDNFAFRSSDRANKKFKAKGTKGLDF